MVPLLIPDHELEFRATRSGGPGGQHVNTSSTRVEVQWNLRTSSVVTPDQRARLLTKLASKIDAYAEQQEVVSEAIERGGSVEMEETDWLRKSFGDDFGHVADKLVAVRLPAAAADDVFCILLGFRAESLKDLTTLDLAGGSLTDEGLLQLKSLKNLRHLDLRGTQVGKLAAEVPGWFERLEFLGLPKGSLGMLARLAMPRRIKLEFGDG